MDAAQQSDASVPSNANMPMTAQLVMPWFIGTAWIPKFAGEKGKFVEWRVQVEAMLRAQGLSEQQQADFVLGALEGEAKRELQLINPRDKDTGQKILEILKKLYAKPVTKSQLRASFFNCKQRADESVNAFILRLRELFFRWQQQDEGGTEEENDLLIDQLMVGLQAGPIKRELSRQMRRNNPMNFTDLCKEAQALEQELQDGDDAILSQRVAVPASQNTTTMNMEQLKGQIQAELQQGLMGEMKKEIMEQMKALSANLLEEMKKQFSTREMASGPAAPPTGHHTATSRTPLTRRRQAGVMTSVYQWDAQGRPICRSCGAAGHVQRRCPHIPSRPQDF